MKYRIVVFLAFTLSLLAACQAEVCPSKSTTYLADPSLFPALASPTNGEATPTPSLVEIGGKMMLVDRVIQGPLCNDRWSGIIYVACDVQVAESQDEENPTFLKDCDLTIEPGSIVYVAAHRDTAYYNGCSCHTGDAPE
jgi:hypothetical protein